MKIVVPATSANLGPGFDSMGMALELTNAFTVEASDRFRMEGQPRHIARVEDHLLYRAMTAAWRRMGVKPRPVSLTQQSRIPLSSGLGSSAACIAAGIAAANHLEGDQLTRQQCIDLSAEMEGHPDNVLPAWEGGLCVGVLEEGRVAWVRFDPPQGLAVMALTPDKPLATAKARAVLPQKVERADAVFNVGRAGLLAAVLASGKTDLLAFCLNDRLHESYRAALIPDYYAVKERLLALGATGVTLSGAGPTLLGWWLTAPPLEATAEAALLGLAWKWQARRLEIRRQGLTLEEA